jgi:hypothetical protein
MSLDLLLVGIGIGEQVNDGVRRFKHFCQSHKLNYVVLGEGEVWKGGQMDKGPGGGQKINRLRQFLEEHTQNNLLMVCDTFDLFPIANEQLIVESYEKLASGKILFAAECYCWPDASLTKDYIQRDGNTGSFPYLNSGSFIGFRDDIYDLIQDPIDDVEDDQLYFTRKYLDGEKIILDHQCQLFQALNGCKDAIIANNHNSHNPMTGTNPVILHGNGASKLHLNHLENYLFLSRPSCVISELGHRPKIFIAAHTNSQAPEYSQFIQSIQEISQTYRETTVFIYDQNPPSIGFAPIEGFNYRYGCQKFVYNDFIDSDLPYYFLLEQHIFLTDPRCLLRLVELLEAHNSYYSAVAPMIRRPGTFQTNFWGALDPNGYYRRSEDYLDIVERRVIGIFNVPYVNGAVLIRREAILSLSNTQDSNNPDMDLCASLRHKTQFMYVDNREICGTYVTDRT